MGENIPKLTPLNIAPAPNKNMLSAKIRQMKANIMITMENTAQFLPVSFKTALLKAVVTTCTAVDKAMSTPANEAPPKFFFSHSKRQFGLKTYKYHQK